MGLACLGIEPIAVCVFALILVGGLPVVILAIVGGAVWGILRTLKLMVKQPPPGEPHEKW